MTHIVYIDFNRKDWRVGERLLLIMGINSNCLVGATISHKMTLPLKITKLEIDIMQDLRNDEDHAWQYIVMEYRNGQKCHKLAELIKLKKACVLEMAKITKTLMGNQSTEERIAMKEAKIDMLKEQNNKISSIRQNKIKNKTKGVKKKRTKTSTRLRHA